MSDLEGKSVFVVCKGPEGEGAVDSVWTNELDATERADVVKGTVEEFSLREGAM